MGAHRARFRRAGSVISINGARFFDHLRGTGGGGVIDLVIHATGRRFPDALRFPGSHAGRGEATVRQRALRADVLEACYRRDLRYADHRNNAVFVCRNAGGHPTGAEILGTAPQANGKRFKGMAPGSRKVHGGFWLPCDRHRPVLVILTESAVVAISARSLRIEDTREHGAVVASTAGITSSVPAWIEDWKPKRIVCADDADSAGDRAARRLAGNDPRAIRRRPCGAKDWNELLLQTR